ncbi:MAG TPA: hypothetical protein VLA93_17535 [Pyrinomonadaceae bacterium]|nr:hypothetical protein [Pyrinomonadaceae bacterium]
MNRLLIGIVPTMAIMIALGVWTLPTNSAGGNVASANGSGHSGDVTLSFGAFDHGEGNVTGQATFMDDFTKTKVTIDVECLTVNGNLASIGGSVAKSSNPSFGVGKIVNFYVRDNGEGQGAIEDTFSGLSFGGCAAAQGEEPIMMVSDTGNIQVRFNAPDKDCTKCPAGTHCGGNGECVGGGGNHCKAGYHDCCGICTPDDGPACPAECAPK